MSSGQLRNTATFRRRTLLRRLRSIGLGCWMVGGLLTSHAATHTWTGTGNSGFWSDAANWQGNSPPQSNESGAVLVFPPGAPRLSSSNDLAALAVNQLVFTGANYALNGTNALTLSSSVGGSITASGSSNRVALPLILQATNSFSVATNASLRLSGRLSGPGAFTLSGGGLLALAPVAGVDNAYLSTTRVLEGSLQLESSFQTDPAFGNRTYATAVPGALVVGDTNSVAPAILTGMAMSTNTDLTLLGSGQYLVNGDLLAFGSLSGDGFVDFQGQSFIVGGNNRSTTFAGRMNGRSDAGLQKVGTGTFTLTGGDVGPVQLGIGEGTLIVDGNFSNSTAVVGSALNGLTGGRLEGNGVLGMIFAGGPFSPGHNGPGKLTAIVVKMDLDSILTVELGGTNAGIDYDQLVTQQTFDLVDPSATLNVQMLPGFVGAVGNQYTIVRLDGTNAVGIPLVPLGNTNGFKGLGEGSVFTLANGAAFRISYQGGDGNDVVLTQIAARPILNSPSLLANGTVLISGAGSPRATYEVQATTNLADPSAWLLRGTTLAQADGSLSFIHTNALSAPQLYYRLHAP
jgi:hypothetical protein